MKKIISIWTTCMLLAAVLCSMCIPAYASENVRYAPSIIRYTGRSSDIPATDLYKFSYDWDNGIMEFQNTPENRFEDYIDDPSDILGEEVYPFIFQNKDKNVQNVELITMARYIFWEPVLTGKIRKIIDKTSEGGFYSADYLTTDYSTGQNGLVSKSITKDENGSIVYCQTLKYDLNKRITQFKHIEYKDGKPDNTDTYEFIYDSNGKMKSYTTSDPARMCYTIDKDGHCTLVRYSFNKTGFTYTFKNDLLSTSHGRHDYYKYFYDSNNKVTRVSIDSPMDGYTHYYSISYITY